MNASDSIPEVKCETHIDGVVVGPDADTFLEHFLDFVIDRGWTFGGLTEPVEPTTESVQPLSPTCRVCESVHPEGVVVSVCEDCERALMLQSPMREMNGITYDQRLYGSWLHLDTEGHAIPQIDREDHDALPADEGHAPTHPLSPQEPKGT